MSHVDLDDSDESIIDDDDGLQRDDDVDIGFRRHQFENFGIGRSKRRHKEENLYGVFYQEPRATKRIKTDAAPMFVAAVKSEAPKESKAEIQNEYVVGSSTTDESSQAAQIIGETEDKAAAEESPEAKKIREEQEAADDYFLKLLNKGRTKQRPRSTRIEEESTANASDHLPAFEGMALGLGVESGSGMPPAFGTMNEMPTVMESKMRSGLGKWEKHTKGIGGKLLAKMGWSGAGGLGSNRRKLKKAQNDNDGNSETVELKKARKGISRPVEVVVRPANLGLGFGSFKEASQLKTNRQIEAEVRGLELSSEINKEEESEKKEKLWGPAPTSSAIPGIDQLLAQKQWKRKRKEKGRKMTIVPYEELLKKQEMEDGQLRIIDMTGQGAGDKEQRSKNGEVPLGAELLHNISFLLNTHENKLHSSSHFLKSMQRKCNSFKSDIEDMKKRQEESHTRIEKLKHVLRVVNQVQAMTQKFVTNTDTPRLIHNIIALLNDLAGEFTAGEQRSLRFWETMAPAILSPAIQIQLDRWDPLRQTEDSQGIVDLIFGFVINTGKDHCHKRVALRDSIVRNQLLPKIKQAFDSPKWIASRDTDLALDLFEYVLKKSASSTLSKEIKATSTDASHVLPGNDEGEAQNFLAASVKSVLIFESVYPKIQHSIGQWKPNLKRTGGHLQVLDRLDLWILPWLPHLDHPSLFPNLIAEIRRKMKYTIEYLQRKSKSGKEFLHASINALTPWKNIFDATALQRLVSDMVTPRLARYLAKQRLDGDIVDKINVFGLVFELHQGGLLADIDFLSVIEGEILARWASTMQKSLLMAGNSSRCARSYREWKRLFLTSIDQPRTSHTSSKSWTVLQEDECVCRIFWSVLRMIQLANDSNHEKLSTMSFPATNYKIVAARRAREKQQRYDEGIIRKQFMSAKEMETRVRLQRCSFGTPTFREVIEEFAKNEGISFQPRMSSNTMKDGRQIFLFGATSIYIEGDVVFALKDKEWLPVALDQLTAF